MSRPKRSPKSTDALAIKVELVPSFGFLVGPAVDLGDGYLFLHSYRTSRCATAASARRAVTRWKRRLLRVERVIGEELLD